MNHSQRLPKKNILKRNDAFREVFEKGKAWRGKWVKVYYLKSDKQAVGFSVPKKHGNAVKRNRAKRLMREVYRRRGFEMISYQIVMIPTIEWKAIGYRDLENEVDQFIDYLRTA